MSLTMKGTKALTRAATRTDLKNVMPSESPRRKLLCIMTPIVQNVQIRQVHRARRK